MCDECSPCVLIPQKDPSYKELTVLLLDCWQREYAVRPFVRFEFKSNFFEERMNRSFAPLKDFEVIVRFLQQRPQILTAYFIGFSLLPIQQHQPHLLREFVESLFNLVSIQFKLMELPGEFFQLLLSHCANMRTAKLNFEGSELKDDDVIALRLYIIRSQTLRCLNVSHCSITQYNFVLLADGVHKSNTVCTFKSNRLLGGCTLSLDTMKVAHIVSQLIWQNKLEKLVLRQCEFISSDIETIAEYLHKKDSKLQKLDLSCNLIGPDGVEYLFRAIANSGTLRLLNISSCGLGSHGGEVVAKYMSSCFRLTHLNISYNDIGHETMSLILTTLKKPIDWQQLQMWGNHFSQKSANILRRLLDARVVQRDAIDITSTFDATLSGYRVIPYY